MSSTTKARTVAAVTITAFGATALAAGAGTAQASAGGEPAVVHTSYGEVRGTVGSDHRSFQGIPYAAPPVGALRWVPPQAPKRWTRTRDATKPGSSCPQGAGLLGDKPSTDEDCLTLNVTTPRGPAKKRPVMVWIHGGGFYSGSGDLYDPARLAVKGDVVVVTLNYRLGVFGFLDHPALGAKASGNFGLQDQQAALRWVRGNAAAFGGDARNVTIFGESAGGESVCSHLAAPGSAGLFQRAIAQSGPCTMGTQWPYSDGVWAPRPRKDALAAARTVAEQADCAEKDAEKDIACLRNKPVAQLLKASSDGQGFGPVYGTDVLPRSPERALATGRFNHVPVIHGTNLDEHRTFVAAIEEFTGEPVTDADYTQQVTDFFGKAKAARVLARYPRGAYGSAGEALSTVWSDYTWGCRALDTDRSLAGKVPTYAYEFADRDAPWATNAKYPSFPTGAFHAADLQYLFHDAQFDRPLTTAQQGLSDQMIAYWTSFAHTGDPNGPTTPTWPRATPNGHVQSLAPGAIHQTNLAKEHQCDFWQAIDHH